MTRAALCVGINTFANYPQSTLQGCVNDAQDMRGLFKDFLGFTDPDIQVLTDAKATKENIMRRLGEMVTGAIAGKYGYLAFSLSSHGSQAPDRSGDEPDRADEVFCPHDLAQKGDAWDPAHVICDDELHDLFVKLPASVLLEVYLDTCHSGTGLRAVGLLPDRRPRFIPAPSLAAFRDLEPRASHGLRHFMRATPALPHQILWAACRSDQTSADASIGGSWHGAFTYYFCKEVRACENRKSRAEVLKKVRADLLAGGYGQTPQLECPATKRALKIATVG